MKLLTVLAVLNFITSLSSAGKPQLTASLQQFGFHRELQYVVIFPEHFKQSQTFILRQRLPAAVYVSTDQLDDLRRLGKINYFVWSPVDTEKPTEKSSAFDVHIFGDTSGTNFITPPIHFRYHAPGNKSFVTVPIDYPELFVEWTQPEDESDIPKLYSFTCSDLRHRCRWTKVEYDNYSKKSISASIPIGNAEVSGIIKLCTITLSWLASVFIVLVIRNKIKAIQNKLK